MNRPSSAYSADDTPSSQTPSLPNRSAGGQVLSTHVVGDLEAISKSMEALEIQFCILSIQMQYDHSPFAMRTMDLARQLGEIHEKLENVVTFGT